MDIQIKDRKKLHLKCESCKAALVEMSVTILCVIFNVNYIFYHDYFVFKKQSGQTFLLYDKQKKMRENGVKESEIGHRYGCPPSAGPSLPVSLVG